MEKVQLPTAVVFIILDTDYETGASDLWKITVKKRVSFIYISYFIYIILPGFS